MTERTVYLDPPPYDWRSRKIEVWPYRWYATVRLNRDGYADVMRRKGLDFELPLAYTEAVDAARKASIDRILYDGSSDTFSWTNGPEWITLFVPFRHVEATVEALRAAELDHDYSVFRALADEMALPVDDWLAPGERQLVRGVDFDPPPSVFLRYLRGKAKQQGVRVNGRATAGSVWIRPTLSPVQKQLREEDPEGYPGWKDRWSDYEEPDNAPLRPWVGGQEQGLSYGANPVEFREVTTPDPSPCPCGMTLQDLVGGSNEHTDHHTAWTFGIRAPKNLEWQSDLAVVTAQSPISWRRLANRVARMPQKEEHYDFNSWTHLGEPEETSDNVRAYLLKANGRVIGYLAAHDTSNHRSWDLIDGSQYGEEDLTLRPRINLIWVADIYRRQGIGATLVRALADDFGCQVPDVSWSTPVSGAGRRLARRGSSKGIWVS
ncbi:GNAT family N-acetyltransferase [Streptomyces sp. NPDC127118]|uniref:GNAT family N-acetyltransferase n=1 Tax=Streptomyces sp. NPDC127118 TaxID=3345369 RepID=UPI003626A622